MSGAVPKLRFPEFAGKWRSTSMGEILERISKPVNVDPISTYQEIGVRSHGRGLFHKEPVLGAALGNKRVFKVIPNALVLNIVFAWEQAAAMTTVNEKGFIASHRFPMFHAKAEKAYLPFVLRFFLTKRGKDLLELASPGGAGRNKTLGQQEFSKLKTVLPSEPEQRKIANFLATIDSKLDALRRKKEGLERFKTGLMQRLFSRTLRFTRDDGSQFPVWKEKRLGELGKFFKGKGIAKSDILDEGYLPCIRYGELYTLYKERILHIVSRTEVASKGLFLRARLRRMAVQGHRRSRVAEAAIVMRVSATAVICS